MPFAVEVLEVVEEQNVIAVNRQRLGHEATETPWQSRPLDLLLRGASDLRGQKRPQRGREFRFAANGYYLLGDLGFESLCENIRIMSSKVPPHSTRTIVTFRRPQM